MRRPILSGRRRGLVSLSNGERKRREENALDSLATIYRVEKNGLQNIAKQDPGRAGQNR